MRTTFYRTVLIAALSFSSGTVAVAAAPVQRDAPHMSDALQTRLTARISAVETKLAAARRMGRVSANGTVQMNKKLAWIRSDAAKYVNQQGFLSAGESASYNRTLDTIEAKFG